MGIPKRYRDSAGKWIEELKERMAQDHMVPLYKRALIRESHKNACEACKKGLKCEQRLHLDRLVWEAMERERWKEPVNQPPSNMPVSWTDPDCIRLKRHGPMTLYHECPHCEVYSIKKRAEYENPQGAAPKPGAGTSNT